MSDDACPCCERPAQPQTGESSEHDQWEIDGSVLTSELPEEVSSALGRFLGTESVTTLGGWVAAVRHHTDGHTITVEDLCVRASETAHWGEVDGEQYYFSCFYDAVILAAMRDEPVDIQTKSPNGAVIRAQAVGTDELSVTPEKAVFSFGIDSEVPRPAAAVPRLEDGYAAICPYVNAFHHRAAYEAWDASVDAATVVMPLAGATELAAALVR